MGGDGLVRLSNSRVLMTTIRYGTTCISLLCWEAQHSRRFLPLSEEDLGEYRVNTCFLHGALSTKTYDKEIVYDFVLRNSRVMDVYERRL